MTQSQLYIRSALLNDIDRIMPIYKRATQFMKSTGNEHQWINGYPSKQDIIKDIDNGHLFVFEGADGLLYGAFAFIIGVDNTYKNIYDGEWLNNKPYGAIHRMASSGDIKGLFKLCIKWCASKCSNLRADTHEDNKIMQSLLSANGFSYCGIIYIANGSKRLAYQL